MALPDVLLLVLIPLFLLLLLHPSSLLLLCRDQLLLSSLQILLPDALLLLFASAFPLQLAVSPVVATQLPVRVLEPLPSLVPVLTLLLVLPVPLRPTPAPKLTRAS
ncbi:hypothetical protein DIPPA_25317, partial [Diplonema papillatum]